MAFVISDENHLSMSMIVESRVLVISYNEECDLDTRRV